MLTGLRPTAAPTARDAAGAPGYRTASHPCPSPGAVLWPALRAGAPAPRRHQSARCRSTCSGPWSVRHRSAPRRRRARRSTSPCRWIRTCRPCARAAGGRPPEHAKRHRHRPRQGGGRRGWGSSSQNSAVGRAEARSLGWRGRSRTAGGVAVGQDAVNGAAPLKAVSRKHLFRSSRREGSLISTCLRRWNRSMSGRNASP